VGQTGKRARALAIGGNCLPTPTLHGDAFVMPGTNKSVPGYAVSIEFRHGVRAGLQDRPVVGDSPRWQAQSEINFFWISRSVSVSGLFMALQPVLNFAFELIHSVQ
jgi:hypothetical protein